MVIPAVPISVKYLKPGWKIEEKIVTEDGRVLVEAGKILTETIIEKLKDILLNNNDDYLVKASYQDELIEENSKNDNNKNRYNEQNFDQIDYLDSDYQTEVETLLKKFYLNSSNTLENAIDVINKCINNIIVEITSKPEFAYSLGQYKEDNDLFKHSLRVARFSIALANIYNSYQKDDKAKINLENIGIAAILHDYGTRFSKSEEMEKLSQSTLSEEFIKHYPTVDPNLLQEKYQEKFHSIYAYISLKDVLSSSAASILLLSSEPETGSLISQHKEQSSVTVASKIIYICNVYDSLLSRVIKNNLSLENVSTTLQQFAEMNASNKELTNLFLENIPLYSVGARVLLSTGEYGIVIERYKGNEASKPLVKTLVNPPLQTKIIDLRDTTTTTIIQIVDSNEKLSDKIEHITEQQLQTIDITSVPEEPEFVSLYVEEIVNINSK